MITIIHVNLLKVVVVDVGGLGPGRMEVTMQDTGNLQQHHGPVYIEVTLDPAISPSNTSPHTAHPAAVSRYKQQGGRVFDCFGNFWSIMIQL